jgi:DNA-binding response OmpR family regulator
MRILIADADETLLGLLQMFFRNCGHDAEVASTGLDCLECLQDFDPDLVVLDRELRWGGSDGVLSLMREDESLCQVPVILISDHGQDESPVPPTPPVVQSLRKPFSLRTLLTQVERAAGDGAATPCDRYPRTGFFNPVL